MKPQSYLRVVYWGLAFVISTIAILTVGCGEFSIPREDELGSVISYNCNSAVGKMTYEQMVEKNGPPVLTQRLPKGNCKYVWIRVQDSESPNYTIPYRIPESSIENQSSSGKTYEDRIVLTFNSQNLLQDWVWIDGGCEGKKMIEIRRKVAPSGEPFEPPYSIDYTAYKNSR